MEVSKKVTELLRYTKTSHYARMWSIRSALKSWQK